MLPREPLIHPCDSASKPRPAYPTIGNVRDIDDPPRLEEILPLSKSLGKVHVGSGKASNSHTPLLHSIRTVGMRASGANFGSHALKPSTPQP